MFFSSIKGINRLITKGMSNINVKVTIEENLFSKFRFFKFKKIVWKSVFGDFF